MQTHEEATVYVKELDIFSTRKVLENTPAVLSPVKLCDENGFSFWVDQRSKTTCRLKRDSNTVQNGNLRTNRSWFLVYQRVLHQACLIQHPWHLQGRKLIIPSLPQARLPHQPWHLQLCQAKVCLDKNGGDRVIQTYRNGCKSSAKSCVWQSSWMQRLTPVPLINHFRS